MNEAIRETRKWSYEKSQLTTWVKPSAPFPTGSIAYTKPLFHLVKCMILASPWSLTSVRIASQKKILMVWSRAVAITAKSQYRAIDEHNRRGMQQPQQPRYFLFFFFFFLRLRLLVLYLVHILNISNDNVYHADLNRGSVNLHLTSLNRQRMREIDWARAITWVCPSGWVMYICENRLSCPRKVKSVLASTLCWSSEPLKVALKVKMISAALHIIITLHISNESAFLNVWLNERFKTHSKTVSYRHRVAQQWNCTDWDPSRTRRLNINRKSILSVRFEDQN